MVAGHHGEPWEAASWEPEAVGEEPHGPGPVEAGAG